MWLTPQTLNAMANYQTKMDRKAMKRILTQQSTNIITLEVYRVVYDVEMLKSIAKYQCKTYNITSVLPVVLCINTKMLNRIH